MFTPPSPEYRHTEAELLAIHAEANGPEKLVFIYTWQTGGAVPVNMSYRQMVEAILRIEAERDGV